MMLNIVQYEISWPDEYHSPGISNIADPKKASWQRQYQERQFSINLQHPRCCIRRFDIANNNTPNIKIVFRDSFNKNAVVFRKDFEMFDVTNPSPMTQTLNKEIMKSQYMHMSNQVEIILSSPESRKLGLTYFIIYSEETKGIVQRQKADQKPQIQKKPSEQEEIGIIESEDDELQKVLKLSREEYEQKNEVLRIIEEEPVPKAQPPKILQKYGQVPRKIVPEEKMNEKFTKILDDVTDQWFDWQRQAEIERNISIANSVLKHRRAKLFDNQAFCVFLSKRKEQNLLIESALRLGFVYVPQPISQCYIFCENKDVLKDKMKVIRDVKILKPRYILDCLEHWKVLDFKDYILY